MKPVKASPPRPLRRTRRVPAGATRPAPRVLVVDADATLLALWGEWLSAAGCMVTTATAVAEVCAARYDLAIVDVPCPRQDGAARVAAIANGHPGMPIIAVSGSFLPAVRGHCNVARAMGASLALPKPLFRGELLGAVQRLLKR